jgi:hypothetical protein
MRPLKASPRHVVHAALKIFAQPRLQLCAKPAKGHRINTAGLLHALSRRCQELVWAAAWGRKTALYELLA